MKPHVYMYQDNTLAVRGIIDEDGIEDAQKRDITIIELFTREQVQQFAVIACTAVGSPIALGKVQQAMEAAEGIVEYLEKGK